MAGSKTSNHQVLLGICSRSAPVALHASLASCGHFFVLLVVVYMQTPCNARTRIEMEHMPAKCDTDCCILYSYIPTPCTTFAPQTYFHRVLRAGALDAAAQRLSAPTPVRRTPVLHRHTDRHGNMAVACHALACECTQIACTILHDFIARLMPTNCNVSIARACAKIITQDLRVAIV